MKDPVFHARKLNGLIRKLRTIQPPQLPGADDPIAVLIMSFLLWESTTDKALSAYAKIMGNVVDFNDLRVCLPSESVNFIGPRYPYAAERCDRLRAALRDIYIREHAVSLDALATTGKRDVKKYIESLDGIVPYVASRLMLLSFSVHAMPVDEQLRLRLVESDVAAESTSVDELSNWLASRIKATDGTKVHFGFQSWIDGNSISGIRRSRKPRQSTGRRVSRQKRRVSA